MRTLSPISATPGLSPEARSVWAESIFGQLSPRVSGDLLRGAREVDYAPTSVLYRGASGERAVLGLVIHGLLRTLLRSPDGREVTLRYANRGRVIGLPSLLNGGGGIEAEALVASRLLLLRADRFRDVMRQNASLAWEVAVYLAAVVAETHFILSAHLFLPVRCRVAGHLLDLAVSDGDRLVVHASHQGLADAIGSVREVVTRSLNELQTEGYLARDGRRLVLLDAAALHRVSLGEQHSRRRGA